MANLLALAGSYITTLLYLISGVFEHSVLCVWEIYALENAVLRCGLWAVQTINFLYVQHRMFERNHKFPVCATHNV